MTTTSPSPESSQEETTNKPVNIGELLRTEREKKGLTLEQVNEEIRINVRTLQALEENIFQLEDFAPVYIHAYLKKYANLLGLDPEYVDREAFRSQDKARKVPLASAAGAHAQPAQTSANDPSKQKYKTATSYAREHARQNFIRRLIFAAIAVIVIAVGVFFGVKFFTHKETTPPVAIQNTTSSQANNSTSSANNATSSAPQTAPQAPKADTPANTPSTPASQPAKTDNAASKPAADQTAQQATPSTQPAAPAQPATAPSNNTASSTPSTPAQTPASTSNSQATAPSTPAPEAKKPASSSDEDILTSGQKISRMLADTKNQYIPTVGVNKITKPQIPLKGLYITVGKTYSRLALVNTKTGRTVHSGSFKPNVYIYTITPGTYRLSVYKNINTVSVYLNGVQQYFPVRKNTIYITVK